MSIPFDPYHKWLGIPPAEQPPNFYRLLGISLFECDTDVIDVAADQRMAILRSFQAGPHSDLTQKLLNEITAAKLCLLKPERRAKYDETLRQPEPSVWSRQRPPAEPSRAPEAEPVESSDLLVPLVESPPARKPIARVSPDLDEPKRPRAVAKQTANSPAAPAAKNVAAKKIGGGVNAGNPVRLSPPIVPRSSAWDQAVAEACAARTAQPRRRKGWFRWSPTPQFVQFFVAAIVLGGMAYGGLFGFEVWQETEFKTGSHPAPATAVQGSPVVGTPVPPLPPGDPTSVASSWPRETTRPSSVGRNFGDANSNGSHFGMTNGPQPPGGSRAGPFPDPFRPTVPTRRPGTTQPFVQRSPVPSTEEQQKSALALKELLKADYQQAKGVGGQVALARKLATLANTTNDDPVTRYVMAVQALDLAVKYCDMQLASGLIYGLRTYYEVDGWSLRSKSLVQLAAATHTADERREIALAASSLVEEALGDDRPDSAYELATLSMNLAGAIKDFALREQARELAERSKRSKKSFDAIKAANEKLNADPADPDANLVIGRFTSLVKQDWSGGLPYLEKGNDTQLRDAVAGEVARPLEPADEVKLADLWWDLSQRHAESKDDLETSAMHSRAVYWYELAIPRLNGLSLIKAKQRSDTP